MNLRVELLVRRVIDADLELANVTCNFVGKLDCVRHEEGIHRGDAVSKNGVLENIIRSGQLGIVYPVHDEKYSVEAVGFHLWFSDGNLDFIFIGDGFRFFGAAGEE